MIPRVLIVEDQGPLETLERAVNEIFPKHYAGFTSSNYHVARCYNDAQSRIFAGDYEFIILDHRMPLEDVGDLEDKDFDAFCRTLQNVGYRLIPLIKKKNSQTIVIGTSSLSRDELRRCSVPDFRLEKVSMQVSEDLEKIVEQVKANWNAA